jgi:hypothetical protein
MKILLTSAYGTKRTSGRCRAMSAFGGEPDIRLDSRHLRFCPKADTQA